MAVRLKKTEVENIAPYMEMLFLEGKSKKEVCKELDVYMGAVNMYLRNHADDHIRKLALGNGRGV